MTVRSKCPTCARVLPRGSPRCPNCDVDGLAGWEGPGGVLDGDERERITGPLPPNRHAAEAAKWTKGKRLPKPEPSASRKVDRLPMGPDTEPTIDYVPPSDSRAALGRVRGEVPAVPPTLDQWRSEQARENASENTPAHQDFVTQSTDRWGKGAPRASARIDPEAERVRRAAQRGETDLGDDEGDEYSDDDGNRYHVRGHWDVALLGDPAFEETFTAEAGDWVTCDDEDDEPGIAYPDYLEYPAVDRPGEPSLRRSTAPQPLVACQRAGCTRMTPKNRIRGGLCPAHYMADYRNKRNRAS